MKLFFPASPRRGRLEIIPLIDIMFFLLAAFMLVSIGKIRVKSLAVNLPTNVPSAQLEKKEDFISVSVTAEGRVQIGQDTLADRPAVLAKLQALYDQNKDQKFLISADKDGRNGDVVAVLGELRAAGFQKIAISVSTLPGTPGVPPAASTPAPAVDAALHP